MRVVFLSIIAIFSVIVIVFCAVTFFAFPLRYKAEIRKYALACEVDPVLVASVIRAESKFKPDAISKKGAMGLMQVMPATAEYVAKMHDIDEYDLANPCDNIRIGTLYLKYLLDKFGDTRTAVMAYNAGEGNVARWLNGAERLTTTPFRETNRYVEKVMNAMNYYKYRI